MAARIPVLGNPRIGRAFVEAVPRAQVDFYINAREVITSKAIFRPSENTHGMIPVFQRIFREHGWPSEQGGTYRKRDCLEAVNATLEEHYPDFNKLD